MAAEVGGAGTKSLDALVREIHKEFSDAMEDFGDNVMDILDITESKAFEKAFFNFRSIVKVRSEAEIHWFWEVLKMA